MIARPLELASKLRTPPRSMDAFHFVNVGVIAVFFMLFGSGFVLAPGLGMDFELPEFAGANAGAVAVTHTISVRQSGVIMAGDAGTLNMQSFEVWLRYEVKATAAKKGKAPVLNVIADKGVSVDVLTRIHSAARAAGFGAVHLAGSEWSEGGR